MINKVETINRELVKSLRMHFQEALDGWLAKSFLGQLKIHVGNATYTESNATLKVEVSLVGKDGEVKTKDAEHFKTYAILYGLKEEDFGKSFKSNGHTYKIVGLKTKSGKYPVIAEREDGKKFKFGLEYIKLILPQFQTI